jgi:hypothetical protein
MLDPDPDPDSGFETLLNGSISKNARYYGDQLRGQYYPALRHHNGYWLVREALQAAF